SLGFKRMKRLLFAVAGFALFLTPLHAQRGGAPAAPAPPDLVRPLVDRLDLEKYKATIKGLTQFGDRRQGTRRNRDAVDWIEAQLRSYNCTPERVVYTYTQNPPRGRGAADSVYVDPVTGDTVRTGRGRGRGRGASGG